MYVKVHVQPGASKETFDKALNEVFHVAVKEKAENNRANKRVLALLAEHFGVDLGKVKIINGHRHPKKMILVDTGET